MWCGKRRDQAERMRLKKKILLALLIVFVLIQFIQPVRNLTNETPSGDITKAINVPDNVKAVLKTACYDCHSNNTHYPWYSRIQPFGWLLAKHISDGKADLNFDEFGTYSLRRRISKMNGIKNSLEDGTMPLSSYTFLHSNARLSKDEKALIIDWSTKTEDSLRLFN